jgi:hypothetical protein
MRYLSCSPVIPFYFVGAAPGWFMVRAEEGPFRSITTGSRNQERSIDPEVRAHGCKKNAS